MPTRVPLTPDILTQLHDQPEYFNARRSNQSTQFMMLLLIVTLLLITTLPILIKNTNAMTGIGIAKRIIPELNPTPTPDSSLLFYIHEGK